MKPSHLQCTILPLWLGLTLSPVAAIGQETGSFVAWGNPIIPSAGAFQGCVDLAAGDFTCLALKNDGSIVAWGSNSYLQGEVPSPNADFLTVASGGTHSLGLKADGSIVAWGEDWSGQCQVPEPNTDFAAMAAGAYHSLGLKTDGSIVAFGANWYGQCSVPTPNADFVAVAGGWNLSLGLKADGSIVAWGDNQYGQCDIPAPNAEFVAVAGGYGHCLGLKADGTVVAWGQNVNGECDVPEPNFGFTAVKAGNQNSVGLKSDGSLVAWGINDNGQCEIPAQNSGFIAIAAGYRLTLGLKADGSIVALGRNTVGQCFAPGDNRDFVATAAGAAHALSLKSDGSIAAWGSSTYGQCSVPLPNAEFVRVAAGGDHSMGLKADGSLMAWGYNANGLGHVPPPNAEFVAMATGGEHNLALKADGSIVAWGSSNYGQCTVPSPNSGFVAIAAGRRHSLGLKSNGTIVGWGSNANGQRSVPGNNRDFVAVAACRDHSLGLKSSGVIVAWGLNDYGQRVVPQPNLGFVALAAGVDHNMGLRADGTVTAWGRNSSRQCQVPTQFTEFVAITAGQTFGAGILRTVDLPACSVEPASLDFGSPAPDDPVTRTFTLSNTGEGLISGAVTVGCAEFRVVGLAVYTLAAGRSQDFTVEFRASIECNYACTLFVGACAQVPLTGAVSLPDACVTAPTALAFGAVAVDTPATRSLVLTNDGCEPISGSAVTSSPEFSVTSGAEFSLEAGQSHPLTVQVLGHAPGALACTLSAGELCGDIPCTAQIEPPPACAVEPSALDFGTTPPFVSVYRTLTLTNVGGCQLTGQASSPCSAYTITQGASYSLAAGQSQQVTVRFRGSTLGQYPCTLSLGNACVELACMGIVEHAPHCHLMPTSLAFGTVLPGIPASRALTINNNGGGTLSGTVTSPCPEYTITDGADYSLSGGQSQIVTVSFQSEMIGAHPCTLQLTSPCNSVSCSATVNWFPICQITPDSLDFGIVYSGEVAIDTLTVTNLAGAVLVGAVTSYCPEFSVAEGAQYHLMPGEQQQVIVHFQSNILGEYSCALQAGQVCDPIPCRAEVVAPPDCEVEPHVLQFGSVLPEDTVALTFTITNQQGPTMCGSVTSPSPDFVISAGGHYCLDAGESQLVEVKFKSPDLGISSCALEVDSTCEPVYCWATVELPPTCRVMPAVLEFGTLLPGTTTARLFTVTNMGGGMLSDTIRTSCPAFTVPDSTYQLEAGQSRLFALLFQSSDTGFHACTVDAGSGCQLTCGGAVLHVQPMSGPASACGEVEDLEAFRAEWEAGLVGLLFEPEPDSTTTVGIVIDEEIVSTTRATSIWRAGEHLDLTTWVDQDIRLYFLVSDGLGEWNVEGDACLWDLKFLAVGESGDPLMLTLGDPAPNPFNPSTVLPFSLPAAGDVVLSAFNLNGQLVERIAQGSYPAGCHRVTWNPGAISSGLYLIRLDSGGETRLVKALRIE